MESGCPTGPPPDQITVKASALNLLKLKIDEKVRYAKLGIGQPGKFYGNKSPHLDDLESIKNMIDSL